MSTTLRRFIPCRQSFIAGLLSILFGAGILRSAEHDGPYILRGPDGTLTAHYLESTDRGFEVSRRPTKIGDAVRIPGVGKYPSFDVTLRAPAPVAPDQVTPSPKVPLFIVGDTHGQFELLVELLQRHRVLDANLHWSFGSGHLAFLGDVFDRGPNHTEIFWLIYQLEQEAAEAGGAVHLVLGNHETLVLLGDRKDLAPKYLETANAMKVSHYLDLWSEHHLLGQWLRQKAAVLKLGDYLLLHGGISKACVERTLPISEMNARLRRVLAQTDPYRGSNPMFRQDSVVLLNRDAHATEADRELAKFLSMGKDGPLWYRGYFADVATELGFTVATTEDLHRACAQYGVKAIVVGHTYMDTVRLLHDRRAAAAHVFMRTEKNGERIAEALRIENGEFFRVTIAGLIERL